MSDIVVHVHTLLWNEQDILPLYLRHYATFADKIFLMDNMSDDRSLEIARNHPKVDLSVSGGDGVFDEEAFLALRSNAYKNSRGVADFVIVCDVDEFVYHPKIRAYLSVCKEVGVTVPAICGYEMLAEEFPDTDGQVYDVVKVGTHSRFLQKQAIFDPCVEINYGIGCHECRPTGRLIGTTTVDLKLLHFKWLSTAYVKKKYAMVRTRITPEIRATHPGWGRHNFYSSETIDECFQDMWRRRVRLVD